MSFEKSSAALVARFDAALPRSSLITPKKMFGYPASWVNGSFFAGLHEENVVLRLPGGLVERLPAMKGSKGFDPMRNGKGMKDWFVVPPAVSKDAAKLGALLAAALPLVAALPVEAPKKKAPTGKRAPKKR